MLVRDCPLMRGFYDQLLVRVVPHPDLLEGVNAVLKEEDGDYEERERRIQRRSSFCLSSAFESVFRDLSLEEKAAALIGPDQDPTTFLVRAGAVLAEARDDLALERGLYAMIRELGDRDQITEQLRKKYLTVLDRMQSFLHTINAIRFSDDASVQDVGAAFFYLRQSRVSSLDGLTQDLRDLAKSRGAS